MSLRDLTTAAIMFLLLSLPAAQAGSDTEHMVLPGENLSRIAAGYKVPLDRLVRYNNLNPNRPLQVGQVLMIPPSAQNQPMAGSNYNAPSQAQPSPSQWNMMRQGQSNVLPSGGPNTATLQAFGTKPYSYYSGGESVSDVIRNFASSLYIPVVISQTVTGSVNGRLGPMPPVDFLNHLANIYGFIWYHDGHTLYVNASSEVTKRIISLQAMTVPQFRDTLNRMGVLDPRFYWREQPNEGLIYISGPPRYVEMVTETAGILDGKEYKRQNSKLTVRIFKLKYAWATDRSFAFRDQAISVPGVATVLQNIINGGGIATGSTNTPTDSTQPKKMKPAQAVAGHNKNSQQPAQGTNPLSGKSTDGVMINADPRLNAIVIHDLESRMPMYEELIRSLDRKTLQVEINVSIVEVNTSSIDELGVTWSNDRAPDGLLAGARSEFNFFQPDIDKEIFTTVINGSIGSLNAKIELLAQNKKAKILSRPSILTLDNLEAVLDNSFTYYVPVTSTEDAQLFPVTYGTVLRVTPRIIFEPNMKRIHLNVNIQDGANSQDDNNGSVVNNSSISTQAVINASESLLIGGFFRDQDSETTNKIPVLGDIPIVGSLFKSEASNKNQSVRLFLITPRVVSL